ncbi:FHA domain-containing protein [Bifidobacterium asteroides]|uniref:FHA domain-containing protein n=1 Tax=Bifidobacterium asteroides TaxID=1684 RepID=A0A318MBV4_9BIFI|nr:FHA domain-containing protein [Bifidobacterium asteroides]PXY85669.1 FHA domain-containing protein [Bifidobacterium asteroides]
MLTELTFAILKYGFLALLWVFVWLAIRSLRKDIETFSPKTSHTRRRSQRAAQRKLPAAARSVPDAPVSKIESASDEPSLLVVIDGPLAGSSTPLSGHPITLGRSSSNTLVLDDEFVSGHHARVYQDPASNRWAIEDLGSTNGTVVSGQKIMAPTILPAEVPVRIGATTFELR